MQLTFQPIVERELRVAARRRSTYWTRGIAALLATGFAIWILGVTVSTGGPVNGGRAIFTNLSSCAWLACLFAGAFLTADCLSFEKREGTLGLLFLTDLHGYDIVLGKLAATSLTGFYGLIAIFPVLAIPILLGGVTWWEFARVAAGLVGTLFFSLALGLLFSAANRREHTSMAATALTAAAWTALFGAFPGWRVLSPFGLHALAFDGQFMVAPGAYFLALLVAFTLGCVFLFVASRMLPSSWEDQPASAPARGAVVSTEGDPAHSVIMEGYRAAMARGRALDRNPADWLVSRRCKPLVIWVLVGLAMFSLLCFFFRGLGFGATIPLLLVIVVHGTLKLCMAWEASRLLAEHLRAGGLELVLVTDLGVSAFLEGCRSALRRLFGGVTIAVIILDVVLGLLLFLVSLKPGGPGGAGDPLTGIVVVIAVLVGMLLLDLWALSWVGLWLGVRHRWAWQAALSSVARVIALPWAIAFAGMLLGGATGGAFGWPVALVMVWVLTGFGLSYGFGRHARDSIHADLREEISAWMPGNVRRKPAPRSEVEEFYELVR